MHDLLTRAEALVHFGETLKMMLLMLALCSLRCYAALFVIPATNDQAVQGRLRNGVCLTIGTFLAWGQPLYVVDGISTMMLLALLAKEALLGVLIGYAVAVVFWVAEGVGALVDNQAGYNNVQQTNPLSGEQSTPLSNLLSQLAICGFYMLGGMVALVGLLFESFQWWPLGSLSPDWAPLLEDFVRVETDRYVEAVVKIAAPALLVLVLVDLGFGLIAKTAEKLEPNNLSQPVKGAIALIMLSLLVALFFEQVRPALALQEIVREMKQWVHPQPGGR